MCSNERNRVNTRYMHEFEYVVRIYENFSPTDLLLLANVCTVVGDSLLRASGSCRDTSNGVLQALRVARADEHIGTYSVLNLLRSTPLITRSYELLRGSRYRGAKVNYCECEGGLGEHTESCNLFRDSFPNAAPAASDERHFVCEQTRLEYASHDGHFDRDDPTDPSEC